MLSKLKIRHRLWLLIALAWAVLSAIASYSLYIQKEGLMQARRDKTYNTLELAYAVVDNYNRLAAAGTLSLSEAQELAKAAMGSLRYDGSNYFSTYDLDYRMVKHPILPEMNGKDWSELTDANGVRIVVELVEAAKRGKGEYVEYLWPKPGSAEPVDKLATSRLYPPWGWVLQTGIYVDDVQAEYRRQFMIYGSGICAAMALLLLASWRIAHSISSPLQELENTVSGIAQNNDPAEAEAGRCLVPDNEIDGLLHAFKAMTERLDGAHAELHMVNEKLLAELAQRRRMEKELEQMASTDCLTKLPNRRAFLAHMAAAIAKADRTARPVVLMLLDLDRFKEINDTLGHSVGDEVLVVVGRRLRYTLRDSDVVARLGGDEFAVILDETSQAERGGMVAQKILDTMLAPVVIDNHHLSLSASIGITVYPSANQSVEALLRYVDLALYQAKASGRGTFRYYTPALGEAAARRQLLESQLRGAIAHGEFALWYQPKVAAGSGRMTGVEALLRWNCAALGPVSPVEFIPVAEDSGLIVAIGDWVLHEACRQHLAWRAAGLDAGMLAVNVSPRQFRKEGLADGVEELLRRTGMAPGSLELELTEGLLLDSSPEVAQAMARLHALGVHLAIDDFGTGYSSLSYLKRFPLQRLKIDRSFVRDLESDADDQAIVGAIIAVARSLGMQVTAEGVENLRQRDFLEVMGCDEFQGYYFSKPLPPGEIEALLRRSALAGGGMGALEAAGVS